MVKLFIRPSAGYHVASVITLSSLVLFVSGSWDEWWTYDGISGPNFWGRLNPKWSLCSRGRRQSPIDVDPQMLLFDPILPPLQVLGNHVNGNLINTGRGIIFKVAGLNSGSLTSTGGNKVNQVSSHHHTTSHHLHPSHGSSPSGSSSVHLTNSAAGSSSNSISSSSSEVLASSSSLLLPPSSGVSSSSSSSASSSLGSSLLLDNQQLMSGVQQQSPGPTVVIGSGPLSYQYTLHHLSFHYGRELTRGSEHTISNFQFPGEIQFYCYNSQLYPSWDESVARANGIAAISVLIQISPDPKMSNDQLKRITHALKNITSKGNSQWISSLSIQDLIPRSTRKQYITYEGSLTQPACHETVQWIILNKPIYMTSHLFHSLRNSMQNEASHSADNYRPLQKLHGRSVRTNIDFPQPSSPPDQDFDHSGTDDHASVASDLDGRSSSISFGHHSAAKSLSPHNHFLPSSATKYNGSLSSSSLGSITSSSVGVGSKSGKTCSMKRPVVYRRGSWIPPDAMG